MTLRVTFEIVPYGEEEQKYTLGTLNINNGGGALGFCTYYGTLTKREYDEVDVIEFKDVNHSRQEGYLVLTEKVLKRLNDE